MNFLYKFKISSMSHCDLTDEIIQRAASVKADDFEKLKCIAESGYFPGNRFESVVQRVIVSRNYAAPGALHRLMQLPQVTPKQKSWALWFAHPRLDMMGILLRNNAPCTQGEKDKWLADFLVKQNENGIALMTRYGANIDNAVILVEKHIAAQKGKLEKGNKEARKKLSDILKQAKKTAGGLKPGQ